MNVLIIANNKKLATKLKKMIDKVNPSTDLLTIFTSLEQGEKYLQTNDNPDIIFCYSEENVQDYFKVMIQNDVRSALVFIASNTTHIASAFLFNTLQFLIEPFTNEDIKFCFDKYTTYYKDISEVSYIKDLQKLTQLLAQKEKEYKKRFMVKVGNVIRSVNVEDIAYIYSQDRINYLVKYNGKKFPLDNTLDEIEDILDPKTFFRANRQFIINIDAIAEIHPYFKGRVKLHLEPLQEGDLIISAEKSRSFKDWLDE